MELSAPSNTSAQPRPVRVAFFSDSFPERNGTGAYYHDLAGQLRGEIEALEVFQPLEKARFLQLSVPMPGDPSQRLITPNLFRIGKGFRELKPDIVVAITPGPFGLLGLYLAKRYHTRFITAFHTDFEQLARIYWNPFYRKICNAYLRSVNKFLCKRSATVLINNSKLEIDVRPLGATSVEVMGTPLPQILLDKPLVPPPPECKQVCFAGRLAKEKNIHLIIEAAARLPHLDFVIGGDGPLRRQLAADAAALPNVRFTGWLSRSQLIDLLDDSSLLLLPSKLETFGSVALEAMARGRPALVSANAGIHDWAILREGLFAFQPEDSLADVLGCLLEQPAEEWLRRAQACREAAEALNRQTIQQWVNVLEKYKNPSS